MAEPCGHPRLDYLDPGQQRGWTCTECGTSGPTVVRCELGNTQHGPVVMLRMLCVCGAGWEWPTTATGEEVAARLAEHADCKEPAR